MKGLGTIVNFLAVIAGSGLGLIIKNSLKQRFHDILIQACGLATLFIGLSGAMTGLMKLSDKGAFKTSNTMLLVFSLVIGGLMFSSLPLLLYQGTITLSAALISHYMDDRLISYLSCIGSVLIFGVGINLIFGKKLKVGNLLPAIIIPVFYCIFF